METGGGGGEGEGTGGMRRDEEGIEERGGRLETYLHLSPPSLPSFSPLSPYLLRTLSSLLYLPTQASTPGNCAGDSGFLVVESDATDPCYSAHFGTAAPNVIKFPPTESPGAVADNLFADVLAVFAAVNDAGTSGPIVAVTMTNWTYPWKREA